MASSLSNEAALTPAQWLRHKAEYTSSLSMSSVRERFEANDLAGVLRALAHQAEREERRHA